MSKILEQPANHSLSEIFKELKFGRPAENQKFLDSCIHMLEESNCFLESKLSIGQKVIFIPMERHCDERKIEKSKGFGTITAVKFTRAKVFYDIVDEYWGNLFDCVDSINVFELMTESIKE